MVAAFCLLWFPVLQVMTCSECCCGPWCAHQGEQGPCAACADGAGPQDSEAPACVHVHPCKDLEFRKSNSLPSPAVEKEVVDLPFVFPSRQAEASASRSLCGGPGVDGHRRLHLILSVLLI